MSENIAYLPISRRQLLTQIEEPIAAFALARRQRAPLENHMQPIIKLLEVAVAGAVPQWRKFSPRLEEMYAGACAGIDVLCTEIPYRSEEGYTDDSLADLFSQPLAHFLDLLAELVDYPELDRFLPEMRTVLWCQAERHIARDRDLNPDILCELFEELGTSIEAEDIREALADLCAIHAELSRDETDEAFDIAAMELKLVPFSDEDIEQMKSTMIRGTFTGEFPLPEFADSERLERLKERITALEANQDAEPQQLDSLLRVVADIENNRKHLDTLHAESAELPPRPLVVVYEA